MTRPRAGRGAIATLALSLVCALAGGCQGPPAPPESATPPELELRLGPGDRLRVSVWGEERLEHELEVGPAGAVSFPLIGDVALAGLTLDEARVELAQRLRASVLVDPVVSVAVLEIRSHLVHVTGEVRKPGPVAYVRGATALGAIQAAGGWRPGRADLGDVVVVRDRMREAEVWVVDVEGVLRGEARDVWLLPGDVVHVPTRLLTRWERFWRQALPWAEPLPE